MDNHKQTITSITKDLKIIATDKLFVLGAAAATILILIILAIGSTIGIRSADLNKDGRIDLADWTEFEKQYDKANDIQKPVK